MSHKLYFTIGPARAGKSTYSKQWLAEHPNGVIVSGDDIRKALHGCRFSSHAEEMVSAIKRIMIRALLMRHDVLVDGTHTTKSSITNLLHIDKNAIPIPILTDKEICIERAIATNQEDLIPVIERHCSQIDGCITFWGSYEDLVSALRETVANESRVQVE